MKTLTLGCTGSEVHRLCSLLGITDSEKYGAEVKEAVEWFQRSEGLIVDGVCGPKTWLAIYVSTRLQKYPAQEILESDYLWAAEFLGISPASLKAVVEVETSGSGFIVPGKPSILFEGHLFWKALKNKGIDPEEVAKTDPDLCYKTWTKIYYKKGISEWDRFERAKKIQEECAIGSASFGIFQILGQNYKACSCESVFEFYDKVCESEFNQFVLGIEFIRNNGLHKYLKNLDWESFAKKYNGPGYKANQYDTKLERAYNKYKK